MKRIRVLFLVVVVAVLLALRATPAPVTLHDFSPPANDHTFGANGLAGGSYQP